MNQCSQTVVLTEKQPCRHLQECPPKRYESGLPTRNTYNPFPGNGNENGNLGDYGYVSNWERKGIESGMLTTLAAKHEHEVSNRTL